MASAYLLGWTSGYLSARHCWTECTTVSWSGLLKNNSMREKEKEWQQRVVCDAFVATHSTQEPL